MFELRAIQAIGAPGSSVNYAGGGGRIAIKYRTKGFVGLPAPNLYTNQHLFCTNVTVKGGYSTSTDGPQDGSIFIQTVPHGMMILFR